MCDKEEGKRLDSEDQKEHNEDEHRKDRGKPDYTQVDVLLNRWREQVPIEKKTLPNW